MNPNKIRIFATVPQQLKALADTIVSCLSDAIAESGIANIALSGGHSPQQLYRLLATESYAKALNWNKVFFFFGDERYVPSDSEQSNAYWANKLFLDFLEVSKENVFDVNTRLPPEAAAANYQKLMHRHFKGDIIKFDLILLGLGSNAHTASLFPFTDVLNATDPSVTAVFVPELSAYRITFTAPLINQAAHIAFLVYGKEKAGAVQHVLEGPHNPGHYPAQLITSPGNGVVWFLDAAAASLLSTGA